ncbi:hypothetical protein D7030_05255 [Flavobacteriaceae bacterium AU392]|nr:hypothetical protein D1817_11730 [Flavobacteriaceae bacterium]RKM86084.1 hypothetical protein D7030_05255 [Flavobacteriaceae bacterium AU392]
MYLNTKPIFTLLGLLFFVQIAWTQQENNVKEEIKPGFEIFFSVNYVQPIFYGDNFINATYDLDGGINFGVATTFFYNMRAYLDFSISSGNVERPELIGNIRSSNFNRVSFGLGYPLTIHRKIDITPSLHTGYIKLRHNLNFTNDKPRDDGLFFGVKVQFNYEIYHRLELNISIINYFDFFRIESASQDQSFFDNAQSIYPSLGLRFKVFGSQ